MAAAIVLAVSTPAMAQERQGEQAFRSLYKELVETNTTLSAGDCTQAARQVAARM